MGSKKYYAVFKGRKTGIFLSWQECQEQVTGFSGALYKSFKTQGEAEEALEIARKTPTFSQKSDKKTQKPAKTNTISPDEIIMDSVCVDASCLGNPGAVEYKGVHTATREVIFHKSLIPNGTNNLGEFLAIVHALTYLKNQPKDIPIYSDSKTAILWVKNKKVKTKLKRNKNSEEIFKLVERALTWLESNDYTNPILKWNTASWGEIPADFGRK
jgi:ribonuclease HI